MIYFPFNFLLLFLVIRNYHFYPYFYFFFPSTPGHSILTEIREVATHLFYIYFVPTNFPDFYFILFSGDRIGELLVKSINVFLWLVTTKDPIDFIVF